jgi:hypothetical protein
MGIVWTCLQNANAAHTLALLRARRERPRGRRAAEQRDELVPFHHSIASSARASRVSGIVMPIALAVLRLPAGRVRASSGHCRHFA